MAKSAKQVYWDACVFLGLINVEDGKHSACLAVQRAAERGAVRIVTSAFTLAEVYKRKCGGPERPLSTEGDELFEAFFQAPYIRLVQVDRLIGVHARRLLRLCEIKKPQDAVHLASARRAGVDEMHTYDGADLLRLDGACLKPNGVPLPICLPRVESAPLPLLDSVTEGDDKREKDEGSAASGRDV